ncbi:hypothetical protein EBU95_19740 [bacterium]|nr:hypothetical protein [bacterium]
MSACEVTPISAFLSTNLNSKIECFGRLGDRILRTLGYPLVTVQVHPDQLNENIAIAVEFFTKYAGYTKEYLVFDSNLYIPNVGIPLDHLFTLAKPGIADSAKLNGQTSKPSTSYYVSEPSTIFVANSTIPTTTFSSSSSLSATFTTDIFPFQLFDQTLYSTVTAFNPTLTACFTQSYKPVLTQQCEETTATQYSNVFDYDILDYRKVIAITDFEEGSSTGINTLFTLEQTLAQQTYFSYALGNYGFDLVSWYTLKEWIETREKLLATKRSFEFDERTQIMKLFPQPQNSRFYGVVSCYVERPIRDVIKEQWVYQYALALTKIVVARVRGNFGQVSLLGGGSLNYTDLLQEGLTEKKELEQLLVSGAAPGYGDANPPLFIVG